MDIAIIIVKIIIKERMMQNRANAANSVSVRTGVMWVPIQFHILEDNGGGTFGAVAYKVVRIKVDFPVSTKSIKQIYKKLDTLRNETKITNQ